MSRLTKKNGKPCTSCESLDCFGDCRGLFALYNKLAHYEDLEEQGRLVETIRCKDCKHFTPDEGDEHFGYCKYWENRNNQFGYCSGAKLAELKGE